MSTKIIVSLVAISTLLLVLAQTGCEPAYSFRVDNSTNQTLTIYVNSEQIASVVAGKTAECKIQGSAGRYLIEAKDARGAVYYSTDVSYEQLRDGKYKIIITPP